MEIALPSITSPEFAEFVGILLGDGCIGIYKCKNENNTRIQYKIQITSNAVDDADYVKYICGLVVKLFNIQPRISRRESKTIDVRFFRKSILDFLMNDVGMVLAPKKYRVKIPEVYINSSLELDVIRGCFDTDGSVVLAHNNGTLYPRLEIKVCESPMKEQIVEILKRNGFNFGVYKISQNEYRIQLNGRTELRKWLYKVGFKNQKHIDKSKAVIAGDGVPAPDWRI